MSAVQAQTTERYVDRHTQCRACGLPFDARSLELGPIPILNRFSPAYAESEPFPLSLSGCSHCGLVQLNQSASIEAIIPRIAGISYRERSNHLESVAAHVRAFAPDTTCSIRALSPFDEPLLNLLKPHYRDIAYIDLLRCGQDETQLRPYIESIEGRILDAAFTLAEPCDVITYRYLLEHCRNPFAILQKLRAQLKPGGILMIEIPDSAKFLERCDYSFIWEEHQCYFTESSIRVLFAYADLDIVALHRYTGTFEDALVVTARHGTAQHPAVPPDDMQRFHRFRERFAGTKAAYERAFSQQISEIALVGIGHQALMFAHLFGLARIAKYCIDDAPLKRALHSEGIGPAIIPFSELDAYERISTAYLAVGPQNEMHVRERLQPYLRPDANVYSIYEGSTLATAISESI